MNEEQQKKFKEAIGDGSTFPIFTDDAEVNYEIDRNIVDDDDPVFDGDPEWSELTDEQRQIYIDEVKENK